jgi:hypothetical protein
MARMLLTLYDASPDLLLLPTVPMSTEEYQQHVDNLTAQKGLPWLQHQLDLRRLHILREWRDNCKCANHACYPNHVRSYLIRLLVKIWHQEENQENRTLLLNELIATQTNAHE